MIFDIEIPHFHS